MTKSPAELQRIFARAVDFHRRGDFAAAEPLYREVLSSVPDHADSWHLLGVLAHQTGKHAPAEDFISRAIALQDSQPDYFSNRGEARRALGRFDDAIADYRQALMLAPDKPKVLNNLGLALRALCKPTEAEVQLRRAVQLEPAYVEAANNLGLVLVDLGRPDEATAAFSKAIALRGDYAEAHANLGTVYQAREDWPQAEACYRAAIKANPNLEGAHFNLGIVLAAQARNREAAAAFQRAIALNPRYAAAYSNLSVMYERFGDDQGYIDNARRAVEFAPGVVDGHRNLGVAYLRIGKFAEGWKEFDWRYGKPGEPGPRFQSWPRWEGQPADSVLLLTEQGLGDEVLYASILPDMRKDVRHIYWQMYRRLIPLLERSFPYVTFIPRNEPLPEHLNFSAYLPSGRLGLFYRNARDHFPKTRKYLVADAQRATEFRTRLQTGDGKKIVGVSWVSKAPLAGVNKTSRLLDWAEVFRVPNVQFVDLQYGDTAEERAELAAATGIELLHLPDLDLRNDIDGLAALISACDLVISISNTTPHISGALGVPTWVMPPKGTGRFWYWGTEKENTTPWYPSVRLFRQSQIDGWPEVLSAVAKELSAEIAASSGHS